jgi:hypothetical protein
MVYIPKLGSCAFVDMNVLVLLTRPTCLLGIRHCDRPCNLVSAAAKVEEAPAVYSPNQLIVKRKVSSSSRNSVVARSRCW